MKITKGQLIAVTCGEYSDYTLKDHVRAVCDFDTSEQIARFKLEGDYFVDGSDYGSDDRFLVWLLKANIIEPLEVDSVIEWWVGCYGELKESWLDHSH